MPLGISERQMTDDDLGESAEVTLSVPVYCHHHTLRAGLPHRLLDARHVPFVSPTPNEVPCHKSIKKQYLPVGNNDFILTPTSSK